ncbi:MULTISPECIES: hypothetical protein [unclassified Caballeronia]|uniref:hypothetical protein n=1 Tax=unclassified Caballeronia TaxID=2646786 RepID=UPI0020290E8D|nr:MULTISPECIES: hypothetical protein [unclassified Caballeronia]
MKHRVSGLSFTKPLCCLDFSANSAAEFQMFHDDPTRTSDWPDFLAEQYVKRRKDFRVVLNYQNPYGLIRYPDDDNRKPSDASRRAVDASSTGLSPNAARYG